VTASGTYAVRVVDANVCEGLSPGKAVTIYSNPTPTITGSTVGCVSPGVALSVGSYSTYQWYKDGSILSGATSQGYTATASGSYTVQVTDGNGCQATSPGFMVTVHANPVPTITGAAAACVSPGTTLNTEMWGSYQWAKNGKPIPGATARTLLVTETGTYTVQVSDSNACSGTSIGFSFTAWANPVPSVTGPHPACQSGTLSTASFSSYKVYRDLRRKGHHPPACPEPGGLWSQC
jgi:hypothetical protein